MLKKLARFYGPQQKFHVFGLEPAQLSERLRAVKAEHCSTVDIYNHLLWMLCQIEEHGNEDPEKYGRWMGFVQGVIWTFNWYSIDELREHVKRFKT